MRVFEPLVVPSSQAFLSSALQVAVVALKLFGYPPQLNRGDFEQPHIRRPNLQADGKAIQCP